MKKLLYILLAMVIFTSCDHEMDNWPDVDSGAAVPQIKLAESSNSYFAFDNIANAEVSYDLSYISKKYKVTDMDIKLVYDNGTQKDTFDFKQVNTLPTKLVINAEMINSVSGGRYKVGTIKPGDNISLYIAEFTLNNGIKITPTSNFKIKSKTKDEEGKLTKDTIVDLDVDNYSKKITQSVFYSVSSKVYVTAVPHGIISGEYTVTVNEEAALKDEKITWTVDGPNLQCSHLVGGIWLTHKVIVNATLIDLGIGRGIKILSAGNADWLWVQIPFNKCNISVDPNTKVITVDYSDKFSWKDDAVIVFTPKK